MNHKTITVRIFLASSINEFAYDRLRVADFINRLNKIYYNSIFFILEKCEDMDDVIFKGGKQAQYDEIIRVSDFVFLLFGKSVGVWTKHEFDVAYEAFQQNNNPKIAVYIKTTTDNGDAIILDDSATAFKKYLNDEIKHFWSTYTHTDTLLFKIIMNLIAFNLSGININVSGNILKDGNEDVLYLQNVSGWCNNQVLINIEKKITETANNIAVLKSRYVDHPDDEEVFEQLKKAKEAMVVFKEDLKRKQNEVFNTFVFCAEKILSGNYSERFYEANKILDDGKWTEAIVLLKGTKDDIDEIYNEVDMARTFEDLSAKLNDDAKRKAEAALDAQLLLIKLLSSKAKGFESWNEVQSEYERTIKLAKKFNLNKTIIADYARFLKEQLYYEKAIPHILDYLSCLNASNADKITRAEAHCDLADILIKSGKLLTGKSDYVDSFGLAFNLIDKAVNDELTGDDYAKIAKCYLLLGRYWSHSNVAELRDATEFEHSLWLLELSRKIWNKISEKKNFIFEREMTHALKLHWQVINEVRKGGSPHREMASNDLLANEAIIIAKLIFFTAGILKESVNKDLSISPYYYDLGECEFELGNIYSHDNQELDTADYFYQNALMRFSLLYSKDEIIERYCHRFRGVIYLNLYACWINKHKHGQIETNKQWSDYDLSCGKNPKWTCEELAMHYLYTAHSMFEYIYPINPNQYVSGLVSAYMMAADRERSVGNYSKSEEFYKKVLKVHNELPRDIDDHSGINREKIEALNSLARLYMRPDNFRPDVAVGYYKQASDFCAELSENKFMFFIPMQIKTLIDSTTSFAATREYETAFDILFDKGFKLMVGLFHIDHFMKFTCWDWWLAVMTVFRHNLIGLVKAGECPMDILVEFISKSIETFEYIWVSEVTQVGTTKIDLLISDSLRGVNKKGIEVRVTDTINNGIHTTVIARAAMEEAVYLKMTKDGKEKAINIIQGRIGYFKGLLERIDEGSDGYLYLVISHDIELLNNSLDSIAV